MNGKIVKTIHQDIPAVFLLQIAKHLHGIKFIRISRIKIRRKRLDPCHFPQALCRLLRWKDECVGIGAGVRHKQTDDV